MNLLSKRAGLYGLALVLAGTTVAHAQFIVPTSYTAPMGATGGYTYYDDTGSQLTDGMFGVDDYTADLGNGPAYEWVAWLTPANIVFTFPGTVTIQTVKIDFNRDESANIFLPSDVMIGGNNFVGGNDFPLVGTEISDNTRGSLFFHGSWTGSTLEVDLTPSAAYEFVDEVQFSANSIPEPGMAAVLMGGGALAWCGWRRKTDSRG